eukprot:6458896-Amphidinium_carterae.1
MEEVSRGWLEPPVAAHVFVASCPKACPALRHAVYQKDKLRPVDDFTRSGANLTNGTYTRPYLESLDEI